MKAVYEQIAAKHKWDAGLVKQVWDEAIKQNLNPVLALAVVGHESNFKVKAKGKRNKDGSVDFGLFQLNSRYHPQFKDDLEGHITYGVGFLKKNVAKYGVLGGLGVYNAGTAPEREPLRRAYAARVMPYVKALYAELPQGELSILESRRPA